MDIETRRTEKRLASATWGAFFLWLGACFVAALSWSIALIGIAVIIWLAQALRVAMKLGTQGLQIAVGLLLAAAGLWDLFAIPVPFVPVVFIAAGAALLLAAIVGGGRQRHQH